MKLLVQIIAWCLFGVKPLSTPMLTHGKLNHQEQTSLKLESKYNHFLTQKMKWKWLLSSGGHFVFGLNALNPFDDHNPTSCYCLACVPSTWKTINNIVCIWFSLFLCFGVPPARNMCGGHHVCWLARHLIHGINTCHGMCASTAGCLGKGNSCQWKPRVAMMPTLTKLASWQLMVFNARIVTVLAYK